MHVTLNSHDLAKHVIEYRTAFGFEVLQYIPRVMAVVRCCDLTLQLAELNLPPNTGQRCHRVEAPRLFDLHDRVVAHARAARVKANIAATPALMPWGTWEFSWSDLHGHRVTCFQWAKATVFKPRPQAESAIAHGRIDEAHILPRMLPGNATGARP